MVTLRRFVVLVALLFWQGGFFFYSAVVVPVGTDELGARRQGFITRRVTRNLNLAGAAALALFAGDLALARDPSRPRRRARAGLWLGTALIQVALFVNHAYLNRLLRPQDWSITNLEAFHPAHRLYLWLSTAQWALALGLLLLTLVSWRCEDVQKDVPDAGKKSSAAGLLGVAQSPR